MSEPAFEILRTVWMDRLWRELFAEADGLLSPREIRARRLDRARVRAAELEAIERAERECSDLRSGRQLRDVSGQLIDAEEVERIPMFSIIESAPADDDALMARVGRADRFIDAANNDLALHDLRCTLNLRRIALLAETEIYAQDEPQTVSRLRPSAQWLACWRQFAQQSYAPPLQRLWARLLIHEVAAPGRFPLAVLDTLSRIGERELEGVALLASYSFREFIFDARGTYFEDVTHGQLFRLAVELGLFRAEGRRFALRLNRQQVQRDPQLLICNRRALQLRGLSPEGVTIPVIRISDVGKQIFRLCEASADIAYLMDLAAYLQARGAAVALGDWRPRLRAFEKRLDVA